MSARVDGTWLRSGTRAAARARRARALLLGSVGLVFATVVAMSCALYVWPAADRPTRVDAVLSLDGANEVARMRTAVNLVTEGYAPVLLFSRGAYGSEPCPRLARVKVVCFIPRPARTVGEIAFAAHYAAVRGWRSLMVVPGHTQATRARLLLARCFKGRAVVVPGPPPPVVELPYAVAYEWAATLKALLVDRGC